jgi:hypothetical protein
MKKMEEIMFLCSYDDNFFRVVLRKWRRSQKKYQNGSDKRLIPRRQKINGQNKPFKLSNKNN